MTNRACAKSGLIGLIVMLGCGFTTLSAFGQFDLPGFEEESAESGDSLVKMSVVLDGSAIVPGKTAMVGIRYTITPKWHIYWRNPGESGSQTEVKLALPPGFKAGSIRWPRPEVFKSDYDTTIGYADETMLFVPIEAPLNIDGDTVRIEVRSEWLVCKGMCLFGQASKVLEVPVAKAGETVSFRREKKGSPYARFMSQIPRPLASMPGTSASIVTSAEGPVLKIDGPARRGARIGFIPDLTPGVRYSGGIPVSATMEDGRFQIMVPLEIEPGDALGKPLRAAGLITLGDEKTGTSLFLELPIPVDFATSGDNSARNDPETDK